MHSYSYFMKKCFNWPGLLFSAWHTEIAVSVSLMGVVVMQQNTSDTEGYSEAQL